MAKEKRERERHAASEVATCASLIPARNEGDTLCVITSVDGVIAKEGKYGTNYTLKGNCFMRNSDGVVLNARKLYVPAMMNDEFEGREGAFKGKRLVFVVQTAYNSEGKLRVVGYVRREGFEGESQQVPAEFMD